MRKMIKFFSDEAGAAFTDYALIASLIAIALFVAIFGALVPSREWLKYEGGVTYGF